MRGAVAPEALGDEAAWGAAAPLEQLRKEPRRSVAITAGSEQDVDDVALLVDGAPQVLPLAANRDEQLVEMPGVAERSGPVPKPPRVRNAKGCTPVPDGFVRDGDTPLREELFHVAKAEREAIVEPDGMTDDGGWEAVAGIADGGVRRPATLRGSPQVDNAARWVPAAQAITDVRRTLYRTEPAAVAAVVDLLRSHQACSDDTLATLTAAPKMRALLGSFRAIFADILDRAREFSSFKAAGATDGQRS